MLVDLAIGFLEGSLGCGEGRGKSTIIGGLTIEVSWGVIVFIFSTDTFYILGLVYSVLRSFLVRFDMY